MRGIEIIPFGESSCISFFGNIPEGIDDFFDDTKEA